MCLVQVSAARILPFRVVGCRVVCVESLGGRLCTSVFSVLFFVVDAALGYAKRSDRQSDAYLV